MPTPDLIIADLVDVRATLDVYPPPLPDVHFCTLIENVSSNKTSCLSVGGRSVAPSIRVAHTPARQTFRAFRLVSRAPLD